MKYYKLQKSIKGLSTYPYSSMSSDYNYGAPNSVHKLKSRGRLNFIPNFNSIKLKKSADPKKLDIITEPSFSGRGIIFSDKLLNIIKKNTLPENLQIFDVNVIHENQNYHYNFFYIYEANEKYIFDFDNSFFLKTKFGFPEGDFFKLNYEELKKRSLDNYEEISPKEILLKEENIKSDIFKLDLTESGYYVSEPLKRAIEEGDCKGIEFIPINELNYKHK